MGKVWIFAVAGNIKKTRIDENGILRYGTSAYKGNTKVYLAGKDWNERLPDENKDSIEVLGLSRSGEYYSDYIPIKLIENIRVTKVYNPKVLNMMSHPEYSASFWGNTQEERDDASAFVWRLKKKFLQ